jgi:hypothetical protein
MRLADGTVAIPPILIGTHASRIREIGALALAVATINSFEPQLTSGTAPKLTTTSSRRPWLGLSKNILWPAARRRLEGPSGGEMSASK